MATRVAAGPPEHGGPCIERLLLDWQSTAEPGQLERLIDVIRPLVERIAGATLHRHGLHDSFAVDEAVSLVLDHLRRLPSSPTGTRPVAPFAPRRPARCDRPMLDSGEAYVVWLTRERAADVARSRRRQRHAAIFFSQLDKPAARCLRRCAAAADDAAAAGQADLCGRLRDAISRLPPRERTVIELLLEGKTQTVIAHLLDVCEGTVSRIRSRALDTLRTLLAE